jgi:hypothetical protein
MTADLRLSRVFWFTIRCEAVLILNNCRKRTNVEKVEAAGPDVLSFLKLLAAHGVLGARHPRVACANYSDDDY